ncbi:MAG: 3'(2'),5'-bisphosphate nucleotidase CysQ [Nitrosomonadales bacterium]|nr:3'(2'),5'-bisphosphate nucleotidase CysQ [Nitrosomonadales bacterium]
MQRYFHDILAIRENMLIEVLTLARLAGQKIMAAYEAGNTGEQSKADGSPLTAADMASHHAIVEGLQRLTPDLPVLSEESAHVEYETRRHWGRFWLVDPLDGTREFIKRNGEFTVNIALIEDGAPVMGVVHAPALGLSYFAERGSGAFRQRGDEAPVAIRVALHDGHGQLKMVGSRSHSDPRQDDLVAHLGGGEFVSMGSSLKLCLVAEGSAHLYPRLGPTMEWDTAAAHAIVLEAGGIVCDSHGESLCYNKPDLHNPPFMVLAADDKVLLGKIMAWK